MNDVLTLQGLLGLGADDAIALGAPGRDPLRYRELRALVHKTVSDLNAMDIGIGDRVAIVLPNGPEMAAAFVAIGAGATTAPLNPGYREEEFDFYLSDLNAKALVVAADDPNPAALAVARAKQIPVIELRAMLSDGAGAFELSSTAPRAAAGEPQFADEDAVALVLHTSGTTSRPKIVPLTQANICTSAKHISASLALSATDRCMNVMPLFHIHGLIAAVISSFYSGGSVHCSPGFNALKFFAWMQEIKPTWYTAVPTMHQAILTRAERNRDTIEAVPLRFLRSSSSSLPPQVMVALEEVFNAPVLEAYGMTEASHQMASNPLPPAARKAGSVGIAAGPEVAIMDSQGQLLGVDEIGEVVIRGANVTAGYESNPEANAGAYTSGWFRTGDQGKFDAEQYLYLTGRLKEIINRGGEKISPREVDEVLMDHPAIAQVVTFAVPHDKLGEEVAAGVVLKEGESATDREIREFAATRLADFKVPKTVLILEEIPKGATGKLQRIGLAEKLGLA